MRTLLIDTDSLIYAAAARHEVATQWDESTWTYHGDFDAARAQLDGDIRGLLDKLKADTAVLALSDYSDPWRKRVLSTYKANRKDTRKPVLLKPLRDYVHEAYPNTVQRPTLEGDDVLGILATAVKAPPFVKGERIICSIDKDMRTIPGLHFNWQKAEDAEVTEVTPADADRWHMTQTLTGDTVDGYKGCPGVGPIKAAKVLDGATTVPEMWERIVTTYTKAGLDEEAALTQARVARICRATDYDFKEKRVVLWEPK